MTKPRKVYLAALAREVAPLVRNQSRKLQMVTTPLREGVHLWANDEIVIGYAGMGAARVSMAFESVLTLGPVASITSIGWAGACVTGIDAGRVLRPSTIVDARTGERYSAACGDGSLLVTVSHFATREEKYRLNVTYGANCVEMEAATVARLAEAHSIPFMAIKSISDALEFELAGIELFHTAAGDFREAAFGLHVALRPWLWKPVMKMARNSKLAAVNHSAEIERELLSKQGI
jgi:adenosylhomocysteine nucleosidase